MSTNNKSLLIEYPIHTPSSSDWYMSSQSQKKGIDLRKAITNRIWVFLPVTRNFQLWHEIRSSDKKFLSDIEMEFELTLLTYKVFSCKDVRSKFLGVRI